MFMLIKDLRVCFKSVYFVWFGTSGPPRWLTGRAFAFEAEYYGLHVTHLF